jgi:hypothetical protein
MPADSGMKPVGRPFPRYVSLRVGVSGLLQSSFDGQGTRVTSVDGGTMHLVPVPELIIVALIALVIFGPRTLWALRRDRFRHQ